MHLTRSHWQEIGRGCLVGGTVAAAIPLLRVFRAGSGSWADIFAILVVGMVGSFLGASIAIVHIRCED